MSEITHRTIDTNGIRMHIAEQGTGPLVILCHGFPEGWYSWRHQMAALAEAGYHAVAPDQRGYGGTSKPQAIDEYTLCHLTGDIIGLVYALGETHAAIAGHDWGAPVAWTCALLRPDLFHKLCLLSVPYIPYMPGAPKPTDMMRAMFAGMQFYQLHFQEPGVAEKEFEEDVRRTVRKVLYSGSGDAPREEGFSFVFPLGKRMIDMLTEPKSLPAWLTEADIDYFTAQFEQSGFRGGLNWYRNMDRNWELLGSQVNAPLRTPTMFVAGEKDVVVEMYRFAYDGLEKTAPGLMSKHLLPGAGHWVQQERPAEVNDLMLKWLKG